jgi:hypothetical protein
MADDIFGRLPTTLSHTDLLESLEGHPEPPPCPYLLPIARHGPAPAPALAGPEHAKLAEPRGAAAKGGAAANAPGVTRKHVPILGDIVSVSTAEAIKAFEADSDVGRPGAGNLPRWFKA